MLGFDFAKANINCISFFRTNWGEIPGLRTEAQVLRDYRNAPTKSAPQIIQEQFIDSNL